MIDLHSHILYGIDDGSRDKEMTLDMLHMAEENGITTMVATPHYIIGANQYTLETLKERYDEVVDLINTNGIKLELLLGNELFLDEYILDALKKKDCLSINNTRYILLEMAMASIPAYAEKILYKIISRGYKPIIAHPERYMEIQSDPNRLIDFIEMGCILQINSTSVEGIGGERAQKTAKLLLESNMVHLMATDCHSNGRRSPRLSNAYNRVMNWIGKDSAKDICYRNPEKVIQDKKIEINKPVHIHEKHSLFYRVMDFMKMAK